MLARSSVLVLLGGICCAGAALPKARPRLPPAVVSEVKREGAQPAGDAGSAPGFRSFEDFLQAQARRPVGLEAVPEVAAARSEAAAAEQKAPAAKDSSPAPPRTDATGGEILELPKMEVTTGKMTKLKAQLAALEANQSWETSSAEAWDNSTVVDAILNPPFLKLGGYSARGRAAAARRRVDMLNWVRVLTISLAEAKTLADKVRIQADIDGIKDIMRMSP
jgi:hypothetical protein